MPDRFINSSFDNFIAKNDELKEIKNKLSNWNGIGFVCLLSRNTGIGKTHLAIATAREWFKKKIYEWIDANAETDFGYKDYAQRDFKEMYEKCMPNFYLESETWRNDFGNIEFNFWLKTTRLIIIDDLFAGKQNEFSRGAAYEIINTRLTNYSLPTIITSNLSLNEIAKIDERIASRLQGGYTFELTTNIDYRNPQNRI